MMFLHCNKTATAIAVIYLSASSLHAENHGFFQPPTAPPAVAPPALPPVLALSFFVVQNGAQTGPFDAAALTAMATAGTLKPDVLVWKDGMNNWAAASTIAELAPMLAAIPAAPPFDGMAFMSGTWHSTPTTVAVQGIGQGVTQFSHTYNADGSVSQYGTLSVNSDIGVMVQTITGQGTYTVQVIDASTFMVTPNIRMTFSVQGQPPATETNTIPFRVHITNQNTITNDEGVIWYRQ